MVRYRRYLIALAIVLVLVGAYAAVGFLAVPYFARKYAQDFVRDHYGRTLSIGEIHFNPFTLNLDISRLSFPDADGKPMLAFGHLFVDLQLASLWRLGPSFGAIVLTQPFAHVVVRPGGALNLVDLEKGFAPQKPKPAAANKPSAPMRLYIGRLQVISGTATFEDRTRQTPFRADFTPIAFELRDFSTRGSTGNAYGLSAASPQGERLNWSGTVHLAPLSSQGTFEITDLKARTLWSYIRQSVAFEIRFAPLLEEITVRQHRFRIYDNVCSCLARSGLTHASVDPDICLVRNFAPGAELPLDNVRKFFGSARCRCKAERCQALFHVR